VAESRDHRQQRLSLAVRDNRARIWHARLPTLLALEIEPSSFRHSAEVAAVERLVAERRTDFHGVSRRRWTIDLEAEAMATLRRFSAVDQPVVLIGLEPGEFFAVALSNTSFLQQAEALVDAVPYFAVVAESGNGGLIFERSWTDPAEGQWSELATWGSFERLPR
jgi:hypothetical protein